MDVEYRDPARRSKIVLVLGVLLAIVAGGAAFYVITQAQHQVQEAGVQRELIVVAARDIAARKSIEANDITIRQVPIDGTTAKGVFTDPKKIIGLVTSVPVLSGQPVFANMLAGQSQGSQFSVLTPDETVGPDSPFWRAVAITVPDDRAAGGLVEPGQAVDIVVTAQIVLPPDLVEQGRYYSDRSTKLVYQDMVVLAKTATTYVIKATIEIAEELSHFQASGVAGFTLLVRPDQDLRAVDASSLGTTTNQIIARHGLPLPEVYPPGSGTLATPTASPEPSGQPSPDGGGAAAPTPTPGTDQP